MDELGSRLVVKALDNTAGKPQSFQKGDIIHCMTPLESFGGVELANPLFLCIHVTDMKFAEAQSITTGLLPNNTGKYISRPSLYYIDIDAMISLPLRGTPGVYVTDRADIRENLKTRAPLLSGKVYLNG